jgi:hypothetical protein
MHKRAHFESKDLRHLGLGLGELFQQDLLRGVRGAQSCDHGRTEALSGKGARALEALQANLATKEALYRRHCASTAQTFSCSMRDMIDSSVSLAPVVTIWRPWVRVSLRCTQAQHPTRQHIEPLSLSSTHVAEARGAVALIQHVRRLVNEVLRVHSGARVSHGDETTANTHIGTKERTRFLRTAKENRENRRRTEAESLAA